MKSVVPVALSTLVGLVSAALIAQAQDPLAEARILTYNVFGTADCRCDQRAEAIGERVANALPPYDIVGVQEYYDTFFFNCGSEYLFDSIRSTGRYPDPAHYRLHFPTKDNAPNGALGMFTIDPICENRERLWDYQEFFDVAYGLLFTRVPIQGTPVTLDVYLVHLHAGVDGCDDLCRVDELHLLRTTIAQWSARSGNPVIVMGDFNISGPPSCIGSCGYDDILRELGNPRDVWFETHPCNPPCPQVCGGCGYSCPCADPGYTNDNRPGENLLASGQARIDYIFIISDPELTTTPYEVTVTDSHLIKWDVGIDVFCDPGFVPCIGQCGHLVVDDSDHYGLEATLAIRGTPTRRVDFTDNVTPDCGPFRTVAAALSAAQGYPGSRVQIWAGSSGETMTINQNVRLEALGGPVRIGG